MPKTKFEAGRYWEERLESSFDLTGVGFRRRSEAYNRWVYRHRTEFLNRLVSRNDWCIDKMAVLDIGCGTGYFIDHWIRRGAEPVWGLDVAEVSIERLWERFPQAEFRLADLSDPALVVERQFDFVSIFDVLYHIVDDARFEQAIKNLARLCRPGCRVIVTDMFGERTAETVKHVRNRSRQEYEQVFSAAGFLMESVEPLFFTLMPPAGIANVLGYWAGMLTWEAVTFVARFNGPGDLLGRLLYRIDNSLSRKFASGPSHHLAVFRFEGETADTKT